MENMKKITVTIIIAFLILSVGLFSGCEKKEEGSDEPIEDPIVSQQQEEVQENKEEENVSKDEKSDSRWEMFSDENRKGWSIYKSKSLGFEFSVPETWKKDVDVEDKPIKHYDIEKGMNVTNKFERIFFSFESGDFDDRSKIELGSPFVIDFRKGIQFTVDVSNLAGSDLENYDFLKTSQREKVANGAIHYNGKITENDILFKGNKAYSYNIHGLIDNRKIKGVVFVNNDRLFELRAMWKEGDSANAKIIDEVFENFKLLE